MDIQSSKGEFYECKVAPNSLDNKAYLYLNKLQKSLEKVKDITYIIACVSAGTYQLLNAKKTKIELEQGINSNTKISLFGMEQIIELSESPPLFNMAV